jgi:hypothetical protein
MTSVVVFQKERGDASFWKFDRPFPESIFQPSSPPRPVGSSSVKATARLGGEVAVGVTGLMMDLELETLDDSEYLSEEEWGEA